MLPQLAETLQRVGQRADAGALHLFSFPAPLAPVHAALSSAVDGERLLWSAGEWGDGWSFAGIGAAARLLAEGPSRFSSLRAQAEVLFARVREERDARFLGSPGPRLFGGASFRVGESAPPWDGFGDADFVLPRWLYARRGEVAALSLVLSSEELRAPARVLAEAAALQTQLLRSIDALPVAQAAARVDDLPAEAWAALVEGALASIRAGHFGKVVLARQARLSLREAPVLSHVAARMDAAYPQCARFAFSRGSAVFVGATPERLVRAEGAEVAIDALAGSLPRHGPTDDGAALLSNDKERREHAHVIDGIQGALGPLCSRVEAAPVPNIRALRDVLHLHTPIRAARLPGTHILSLVEALHPTPAVCGLPRVPAEAWLVAHEPAPRGWYAAPVGHFDGKGDGEFAVALRSAVVRGREAWLYAGAGLVEGSDPAREYAETAAKQAAMLYSLGVLR